MVFKIIEVEECNLGKDVKIIMSNLLSSLFNPSVVLSSDD